MVCVAVRCQRRVGSVGRSARSFVTGLVHMDISTRLVGSQAYWHDSNWDYLQAYQRVLVRLDSSSKVIIVVMRVMEKDNI